MRYTVTLTIDLEIPPEQIGRRILRQYIKDAVEGWRGSMPPAEYDDPSFDGIKSLEVQSVSQVEALLSAHDARKAGGIARWSGLTSNERSELAKRAANARWNKRRPRKRQREELP